MTKLPSEALTEAPAPCWCCNKLTTHHIWGVYIHTECLDKHYGGDEDQLLKDIETEMESW